MTEIEILNKALEKAIKNGYNPSNIYRDENDVFFNSRSVCFSKKTITGYNKPINIIGFIFSHEFAKAFWGTSYIEGTERKFKDGSRIGVVKWKNYLQRMVIHENPIEYLKQFIDK